MLRVTVEIIPFGIKEKSRIIGVIDICNVETNENDVADYKAVMIDSDGNKLFGKVGGHRRKKGAFNLIFKMLKSLGFGGR